MIPSNRISGFLTQFEVDHEIISHETTTTLSEAASVAEINLNQIARAVILQGNEKLLMAVLPATHVIDFAVLFKLIGEEMQPAAELPISSTFSDCEPGSVPPVALPYGIGAVIDIELASCPEIYFEPGSHSHLFKVPRNDFFKLHVKSTRGSFSRPANDLMAQQGNEFVQYDGVEKNLNVASLKPIEGMKQRIESLRHLPTMPEMTSLLLRQLNKPDPSVKDLARVIEKDPSLAAQVIRQARSPYYGYQGKIESIESAIEQVLGFEMVMNMALGLATSKAFSNPSEGPLGLKSFWRHAVYSATLCQSLCSIISPNLGITPGNAYLAGLLHNIGFLLMGHKLKPEFYLLNRVIEANPDVPIPLIEKRVLGVGHNRIGAWLLNTWDMPKELIAAAGEHHNESYVGPHASYARLVLLVDHLLKRFEIGDAPSDTPPPSIVTSLGINVGRARELADQMMDASEELDTMTNQLSA